MTVMNDSYKKGAGAHISTVRVLIYEIYSKVKFPREKRSEKSCLNRPRSLHQYSNMASKRSGHTSIFGGVFTCKSLLRIVKQKKLAKFAILTRKPRIHARILIYRRWSITSSCILRKGMDCRLITGPY